MLLIVRIRSQLFQWKVRIHIKEHDERIRKRKWLLPLNKGTCRDITLDLAINLWMQSININADYQWDQHKKFKINKVDEILGNILIRLYGKVMMHYNDI